MTDMAPPSTASPIKLHTNSHLDIPTDDEVQRGRKRRRSSNNSPPPHLNSHGSTTHRGRSRRRSPSFALGESIERRDPNVPREKRRSPVRKHAKREYVFVGEEKRRSQSLSRSRTRGVDTGRDDTAKPRRRQRTMSRSRKHGVVSEPDSEKPDTNDDVVEVDEVAVED